MNTAIIIHPKYEYLRQFIEQLPDNFSTSGEFIHDGRNQIKKFTTHDITVNVKRYRVPFLVNRIIYNTFRPTKAKRAYEYALKLRSMDINTPEPVAYITRTNCGILEFCYFISVQVSYPRRCYEFKDASLDAISPIVTALARYAAHLHELGVYHKDFSPGNILFDEINGQWEFCIVDINRMEFVEVDMEKGCKNFARLWGQDDMFRLLAQEYGVARHFDTDECVRLVLKYRRT